jgi:hypothetical protein
MKETALTLVQGHVIKQEHALKLKNIMVLYFEYDNLNLTIKGSDYCQRSKFSKLKEKSI